MTKSNIEHGKINVVISCYCCKAGFQYSVDDGITAFFFSSLSQMSDRGWKKDPEGNYLCADCAKSLYPAAYRLSYDDMALLVDLLDRHQHDFLRVAALAKERLQRVSLIEKAKEIHNNMTADQYLSITDADQSD